MLCNGVDSNMVDIVGQISHDMNCEWYLANIFVT